MIPKPMRIDSCRGVPWGALIFCSGFVLHLSSRASVATRDLIASETVWIIFHCSVLRVEILHVVRTLTSFRMTEKRKRERSANDLMGCDDIGVFGDDIAHFDEVIGVFAKVDFLILARNL